MVHVTGDHVCPESGGGQDRGLGACVKPLNVCCWIAFCVAKPLGLAQRIRVSGTFEGHFNQYVVSSSVDDAHNPSDRFADQGFTHRPHQGDAPGHRGLKEKINARCIGGCEQFRTVIRDQLLVRRDDRLASSKGVEDQASRRFDSTDHLDDDVDRRIVDDRLSVTGEDRWVDVEVAVAGNAAHADRHDLQVETRAFYDLLSSVVEETNNRTADDAAAKQPDTYFERGIHHYTVVLARWLARRVSPRRRGLHPRR